MSRPKKVIEEKTEETTIDSISLLSVDYGREDLNNVAMKINEVITKINSL